MAVTAAIGRLIGIRLITYDAARLATFYETAFGFTTDCEAIDRFGEGVTRTLTLAGQTIELLTPMEKGRPYPLASTSADTIFQHIAMVVSDMTAAMARLSTVPGWTAISTHGPEILPASSGGVAAFKFRDPDGHPLELLQFADGAAPPAWQRCDRSSTCWGYDHSAITVSDTAASLAFYVRLGLAPETHTTNRGTEQARLDDEPDAVVDVTGLHVAGAPPHLELLCYRRATARTPTLDGDIAATQLVFAVPTAAALDALCAPHEDACAVRRITTRDGRPAARLRDPDGHRFWLVVQTS